MKTIPMTQGSEEWIAFRRNGIGASDIPAILGMKPCFSFKQSLAF